MSRKSTRPSQTLDEIKASLESGTWQATSLEHIPLITTYALIHWVFDYPRQSDGYGFPFDRPHLDFYRRLQKVHQLLEEIMDVHLRGPIKDNKPFFQIYRTFKKTAEDKPLNDLAASLERKAEVFDLLRTAMRITLPESKNGINDNGDDADMKSIKEKVTAFRRWMVSDEQKTSTYAKMLQQLDKYWGQFRRSVACCYPRRSPVYSAAKNEQHPGAIFSGRKTTWPQKERNGIFEQGIKSGSC